MEDVLPHKCIYFVVRVIHTLTIVEEVIVEVSSVLEHEVAEVFNLLHFPEHINVLHFVICKSIESIDEVFPKIECKLVL